MKTFIISLMVALSLPAWAQEDEMKDFPGYVDFGELSSIFGEPSVQIAVGKSLLGLVSAFSASEDPEAAQLFDRLHGVRVNVFETQGLQQGSVDYVKDVSSRLSGQGWESVVSVNTADEQVRIFMKINGDAVEGITVMAVEEDEAAFINVIGNLNPAELEQVMDNFDIELNGDVSGHEDED
jgi:hypothetical protein